MTDLQTAVVTSKRRAATLQNYLRAVQKFEAWLAGRKPTGAAVESWRDYLLAQGMSPRSVNAHLFGVRFAARRHNARTGAPDFAAGVELLPVEASRAERRALSADECRALLASCEPTVQGVRDRALLELGLRTGMRRDGLVLLDWADVDIDSGQLTYSNKGGGKVTITVGKPRKSLGAWWRVLARPARGRVFRAVGRENIDGMIAIGSSLSWSGLYAICLRRGILAGVGAFHPHVMRHTFVSLARAAGVPDWQIARVTGHKLGSILDTYSHEVDDTPIGDLLF